MFVLSTLAIAGHSAFSADGQGADDLSAGFAVLAEPIPLSLLPIQIAGSKDVILKDRAGTMMLINVWATWCAPCVEEMPALDALQGQLGSDNFEVVTISMDRHGMEDVAPFFADTHIQHLVPYTDVKGDFSRAMGAMGLPVTFLVKDGMVIRKIVGPADWGSDAARTIIESHM